MTKTDMDMVEKFGLLAAKCDVLGANPSAPEWEQREFVRLAEGYREAQLWELNRMAANEEGYPLANVLGEGPNTSELPNGYRVWRDMLQVVAVVGIASFILLALMAWFQWP